MPMKIDDPRSELVSALLEYRKIKQTLSAARRDGLGSNAKRLSRGDNSLDDLPKPEPELVRVDVTTLMIAFGDILRKIPKKTLYQIRPEEITVEMRKEHILRSYR